jgi:hypothetical protein
MTTWQELSAAERRVLDNANEDYTQLWELLLPVTLLGQDRSGSGQPARQQLPPIPTAEAQHALRRLLELGLVELVRRRGVDQRSPVAAAEHDAVVADPVSWDVNGPKEIEVVATEAGRAVWLS